MLLAQLYCLDQGLDFSLCSRYWNAAHKQGWIDYFLPFCDEVSTPSLRVNYLFKSGGGLKTAIRCTKKVVLGLMTKQPVLLNYDIWPEIWNVAFVEREFRIPILAIEGDCFAACQALLNRAWKFNGQTTASVRRMQEALGLVEGEYFTLHIRRGDKWHEAKPIEIYNYMRKADEVNRRQLRKCFLMTDDYSVVKELRRGYPKFEIFSLCDQSEQGHLQNEFNLRPAEARRNSTLRLLAELVIAKGGSFFVGTFSSNVGRLVAMLRGRSSTFGVDIPFTLIY
jgi:hypothetical protein